MIRSCVGSALGTVAVCVVARSLHGDRPWPRRASATSSSPSPPTSQGSPPSSGRHRLSLTRARRACPGRRASAVGGVPSRFALSLSSVIVRCGQRLRQQRPRLRRRLLYDGGGNKGEEGVRASRCGPAMLASCRRRRTDKNEGGGKTRPRDEGEDGVNALVGRRRPETHDGNAGHVRPSSFGDNCVGRYWPAWNSLSHARPESSSTLSIPTLVARVEFHISVTRGRGF